MDDVKHVGVMLSDEAREPGNGVRIDDRCSKDNLTNSSMGLFDLFPKFLLMGFFPQEADARHP
jgi:hypothetical protein